MPLSLEYLREVRERYDAATPEPWYSEQHEFGDGPRFFLKHRDPVTIAALNSPCLMYSNAEADAQFIAHARHDVPTLLDAYEEAVKAAEEREQVLVNEIAKHLNRHFDGDSDEEIGRSWRENSSLEKWFPFTAEELKQLRAERDALKALIGQPPEGSHPDERQPRSKTWHEERLAWIAEVEQNRAHIKKLEATGIDGALDQISALKAELEREVKGNQEWIDDLCKQLCAMEDALGFRDDQHDKQGQWVPTIGPWLERIRDLIAAEGELGDVKAKADALASALQELRDYQNGPPLVKYEEGWNAAMAKTDAALAAYREGKL